MGTPLYMSPEQWRGKNVDHRSDIFSLGVMAYELLSGQRPYQGETPMDLMVKVATEEPPLLSSMADGVPPGVDEALAKMLASEPEDRPAKASTAIAAIADAYNAAGAGMVTTMEPRNKSSLPPAGSSVAETTNPGVSQTLEEPMRGKKPWLAIGIAAAVLVGVVVVGMGMSGEDETPTSGDGPAKTEPTGTETSEPVPTPEPTASATASAAASTTATASATASASASSPPPVAGAAASGPNPQAATQTQSDPEGPADHPGSRALMRHA